MINLAIVYYFLGLKSAIYFTLINLVLALAVYFHIKTRYYTPFKDKTRDINDAHSIFTGFNRSDNCPSFQRVFLGLLSFVYIKLFCFIVVIFMCYLFSRVIAFLARNDKEFYKSKLCFHSMKYFRFTNYLLTKISGLVNRERVYFKAKVNEVYKKYLGDDFDYEKELASKDYATVISNHIGWLDIFYIASITGGSFTAKLSVKKFPLVGIICDTMNTVWVDRSNKSNNKGAFEAINTRQEAIMKGECMNKLVLFPEGTGSNNTGLIQFKKGAFHQLNPVKPFVILVYGHGEIPGCTSNPQDDFSLAAGAMKMVVHVLLTFCYLYFIDWKVYDLPVVRPNEYMFETYKNLGKDRPEVFCEVSRRIMSECSGLPLQDEMNFEKKLEYLSVLKGKEIKNT